MNGSAYNNWSILKDKNYVTPEMFGAVGDGVTDDTEALQSAIDYIGLTDNYLYVPGKTYVLGKQNNNYLYIYHSNITIILDSNANIRQKQGENAGELIHIGWDGSNFVQVSNIHISGGNFYGNAEGSSVCSAIVIEKPTSDYTRGDGCSNITISGSKFLGGFFASIFAIGCVGLKVHDCYFTGNYYSIQSSSGGYSINANSCDNLEIYSNQFVATQNDRHAIYIPVTSQKSSDYDSVNVNIHDNLIDWTLANDPSTYSFSIVCAASRNVSICKNTIKGPPGAISFNPEKGDIKNVLIAENTITDLRGVVGDNRAGVVILRHQPESGTTYTVTDIRISSNYIQSTENKVSGVYAYHLNNFSITENIIDVTGENSYGILIRNHGSHGTIHGNTLKGSTIASASYAMHFWNGDFTDLYIGKQDISGFVVKDYWYQVSSNSGSTHNFLRSAEIKFNSSTTATVTPFDGYGFIASAKKDEDSSSLKVMFNKSWPVDYSAVNLYCTYGSISSWSIQEIDKTNNIIKFNLYKDTSGNTVDLTQGIHTFILQIFN